VSAPEHVPLLGCGQVRHTRLRPARNSFAYDTYFLMLPLRTLRARPSAALARNRFGLISFFDRDHGDGGPDSLAWIDALLAREGIAGATGEVWLHCYPRVLGYTFKPVSFWYCHRADDSLAAIVVEVNNTFGERHCYLLNGPDLAFGKELQADKVFHVSPFCGRQLPFPLHAHTGASGHRRPAYTRGTHGGAPGPRRRRRPAAADQRVGRTDGIVASRHSPRLLRHAADDAGRDCAHSLAGAAAVGQASALLSQAQRSRRLSDALTSALSMFDLAATQTT